MNIPFNKLSRKFANRDDISEIIGNVLQNGYFIHGPQHKLFELELAQYLGAGFVLGVGSGTDALEIALRAVGCKKDSKVINVANAGGYTSLVATNMGCHVIFCDVDPSSLVMSIENLESLLAQDVSAVVVTHLFGNIAPIEAIVSICRKWGIKVIEDCAQAIGGFTEGGRVGTIGDIGTFSFYPTKNLGGIGDGGAVATNNPKIAGALKSLRQYGWGLKYHIDYPNGINSRLDEVQAAVLRIELEELDALNSKRRKIMARYAAALANSRIKIVTAFEEKNAPHLAVLILPEEIHRDDFIEHLLIWGIQTEVHYPVLDADQSGLFKERTYYPLDVSRKALTKIVSIPLFPELLEEEVDLICEVLANYPSKA